MKIETLERLETSLLLEAIYRRYGHDFRSYARGHVQRRIRQFLARSGYGNASELIPRVLHDEHFFGEFLGELSITVSEMFRDPPFFRSLRESVVPYLRTYPFVRVWIAGCATGEEAYSVAILMREEGLDGRTTIFATDFNDTALERAREGIYPVEAVRKFTRNYQLSGGRRSFSEYYHAHYDSVVLDRELKEGVVFANHNLATDGVFGEMHLILCRNVLIYFGSQLRERVFDLFSESLVHGGFLCLGSSEDIRFSARQASFKRIDERARIFQKKADYGPSRLAPAGEGGMHSGPFRNGPE